MRNKEPKQQRVILPIILWLVPLLAINLGFIFLSEIDLHWREIEQSDFATQEVEGISATSDFSYQFSNICGQFGQSIKSGLEADLQGGRLEDFLLTRSGKIFRHPFPEKKLLVFRIPEKGKNSELVLVDGTHIKSKRAFVKVFEYLVALSLKEPIPDFVQKPSERLLTKLLGAESNGSMMAFSQRAKTTYAIFEDAPHWLYWDFFSVPGKGTFGYMVLSKTSDNNRFEGMLLSLRNFRDRRIGLAAFIPLFRGYGSSVIQAPLHKSKIFKSWVANQITPVEDNLSHWLASGTPPVKTLGNFRAFTYLGKGNTHLSALLLPKLKKDELPVWLKIANFIIPSLILILLLRGFLLKRWPKIRLKLRFQMTFLLAATLPLSLLLIASSGYISQYRRSIHFQTSSNLLMNIKQFDSRKAQIEEAYIAAFSQLVNKPEFIAALKKEGPFSKEAEKILQDNFMNRTMPLPIMCYALFDDGAQGFSGASKGNEDHLNGFLNSFSYPIVEFLRRQLSLNNPEISLQKYDPPDIQRFAAEAYRSVASRDLIEEIGKRRSFPLQRVRSNGITTQMHEYIKIDGVERYAILISWEDNALDKQTIRQTTDFLALRSRDFSFIHFKASATGVTANPKPDRHVSYDAMTAAEKLATAVYFKGSYSSSKTDKHTLVAYPSVKYPNTIIVGISNDSSLQSDIFNRLLVLSSILALAVIIVILIAFIIAKVTLEPITNLKKSLDHISSGNLDVIISTEGQDELGRLANEFSNMADGLRERNRLATLLSDQAIEAISKNQATDGILSGESFYGVALVSDIRNFTGMCENYPPDKITELLNEHFARMAKIISGNGGRIYKFIGDAIEAVFPDDSSYEESPENRAFKAATLMNVEQIKINLARSQKNLFTYQSGIGLAAGQFFAGGTGSIETRLDYAVLGEALKRAADLEAESKSNQAFPIIVDKKVAEALEKQAAIMSKIEGIDGYSIFEFTNSLNTENPVVESDNKKEDLNLLQIEIVDNKTIFNKSFYFGLAIILTILVLSGIFKGLAFRNETLRNIEKVAVAEKNLRLIEQLKGENVIRIGFESLCFQAIRNIEKKLKFSQPDNEKDLISSLVSNADNDLRKRGLKLKRIAAFSFAGANNAKDSPISVTEAFFNNWSATQLTTLKDFALYKFNSDHELPTGNTRKSLDKSIPGLLGENNTMSEVYFELFSSAFEAKIDGFDEYVFPAYLVARSGKITDLDLSQNVSKLNFPGKPGEDFRIAGMIIFTASFEDALTPELVLNSYADNEVFLAMQSQKTGIFSYSMNFPQEFKSSLENDDIHTLQTSALPNFESLKLGKEDYKIAILSKFSQPDFSIGIILVILLALAALLISFFLKASKGESFINRSLAAKLWLGFFTCSIIPVVTAFFVIDLFSIENFNARFSQEKANLQRFLDLFEHRQTFSEPLAWKTVKTLSYSKELKDAVTEIDRQPDVQKDYSPLETIFNQFNQRAENLKKTVSNFEPRSAVIVSKTGWEFINHGNKVLHYDPQLEALDSTEESDDKFTFILVKIAKNLISRMRGEEKEEGYDAESIAGEMAIERGLKIVSAMFGEDSTIKLANGVGLPVKMGIIDSETGLIIYPVEQISMPDFIVIWMILFNNSGYLTQIANMFSGNCAVFSIPANCYGHAASPFSYLFDFGLVKFNSWVNASNRPLSLRHKINGKEFLIETRRGIKQTSMIITGIQAIEPITKSVASTRIAFIQTLLLTVFLIILLARNISAEILEPLKNLTQGMKEIGHENFSYRIAIDRGDEIGDLCISFDKMAKGLEEKFFIGKMLSQTAMDSTLKETASIKEEVVVIYVGSPGFSSWLNLSSPGELFADLQKQVAGIAGIILTEGGEIDKIIGEKILAVFKGNSMQAALAACQAARKILDAEQKGALPFPVAAGINKGVVISGILGVGNKKDFTVIGDAVNVAARIESLAETMRYHRILISEEIYTSLAGQLAAREHGTVELKGKTSAARVFQLDA